MIAAAWALSAALAAGNPGSVELKDDVGRTITLAALPRRIVSTAPSNTEALFALGAGDRVVGVTTLCVDPPEAKSRAKVGDFSTIDFEKVLALKPDLVVATWLEQRRHVERMESLGLKVLVLYPKTVAETLESMLRLGRAIGAEDRAKEMVADLQRRLDRVDAKVKALPADGRPRVFVELSANPLYTAGPGSTVDEAIERAGGRNIAHDLGKPYATIGREVVIDRDPEVVLLGATGEKDAASRFAAEAGFERLSAVRKGRVYDRIDPAILFHQNHRLVEGIETLYRLLHGE